eukprot:CAMPEP_0113452994 /NCGR_PEP_ID=MMETSP0014_2-20120614/7131_1 /TAXON_ID=2857 /ORGANISM="Nitzschia sp." /LENGTH=327 /DNA_ID=CAMNT_0000344379 /DNA_START=437 /DNA_END=1420 /DNA_ORIENTATION=- /assembly_acc=CAM_ASM_000159
MNMETTQHHHHPNVNDHEDSSRDHEGDRSNINNDSSRNKIGRHDVLCGRGGLTNQHIGNKNFRYIVAEYTNEYLRAKKKEKKEIAVRIVQRVHDIGGRFLTRCGPNHSDVWAEVTASRALEKSKQALREGLDVRHKTIRPEKHIHRRDSESSTEEDNPRKRARLVQGVVMESPTQSSMSQSRSHQSRSTTGNSSTTVGAATKSKSKKKTTTKKTVRIKVSSNKTSKKRLPEDTTSSSDVPELVQDAPVDQYYHSHVDQTQYRAAPRLPSVPSSAASRFPHSHSYYPQSYSYRSSAAEVEAAAVASYHGYDDHGYDHAFGGGSHFEHI